MENDFNVGVTFTRVGEGEIGRLEIRLYYRDISRVVIEGQEYISMVEGPELLLVDSKIKEFDEIIQKLNLWYIFNIYVNKHKTVRALGWDINTSQLDKEDEIKRCFKLFLRSLWI